MNPKFDRRFKNGQELGLVLNEHGVESEKSTLLCVMDAMPRKKMKLSDPGLFPKEMATHITDIYKNEYTGFTGRSSE